jgi:hypothetical protein
MPPNMTADEIEPAVHRIEVIDALEAAFRNAPLTRAEVLGAADAAGVRLPVMELLERLPVRPYRRPADLWDELPGVPIGA